MPEVLEMCGCRNFTRLGPRDADRYADHSAASVRRTGACASFFGDAKDFLIELHAGAAASDQELW